MYISHWRAEIQLSCTCVSHQSRDLLHHRRLRHTAILLCEVNTVTHTHTNTHNGGMHTVSIYRITLLA